MRLPVGVHYSHMNSLCAIARMCGETEQGQEGNKGEKCLEYAKRVKKKCDIVVLRLIVLNKKRKSSGLYHNLRLNYHQID